MAYVNQQSRQQRAPVIAATAAIQAGLIYALVNGFAGGIPAIFNQPPPLIGTQIDLPKPQPTEPVKDYRVLPDPHHSTTASSGDAQSPVDSFNGVEVTAFPTGGGLGPIGPIEPRPQPTAKPDPMFAPKAARPVSSPGGWVTPDDYPSRDLRERREGLTRFKLTVGIDGSVRDCAIIASSGSPSLDEAACAKLRKRGRFAAATDDAGAAVAGSYSGTVRWKLPID